MDKILEPIEEKLVYRGVQWEDAYGDMRRPSGSGERSVCPANSAIMRSARKRRLVDHVRPVWQVSTRRACRRAVPVDQSTYHYRSKRDDPTALKKRIREIAEMRVR